MVDAAQVGARLLGQLHLVDALLVGLPHVERGPRDGLALQVAHLAGDVAGLAFDPFGHVAAGLQLGGIVHVEWPQHRVRGGPLRQPVVQHHRQHRQADDVAHQDVLAPRVGGPLADPGEEVQALQPFLVAEVHLPGEGVHVLDRRGHDLGEPRVVGGGPAGDRLVGDGVEARVGHRSLSS